MQAEKGVYDVELAAPRGRLLEPSRRRRSGPAIILDAARSTESISDVARADGAAERPSSAQVACDVRGACEHPCRGPLSCGESEDTPEARERVRRLEESGRRQKMWPNDVRLYRTVVDESGI